MLMTLLAMGVLYFVVVQLDAVGKYQQEAREGRSGGSGSMDQAREALLAYATTYRDNPSNTTEVFGYLPCPDTSGSGQEASSCGAADEASVGLFPYKTLGLPDIRDSQGECLWYAVSGRFKNYYKTTGLVNWDGQGQFSITDSAGTSLAAPGDSKGGAAAVIFSPGPVLAGQTRSAGANGPCAVDPSLVAAYLDGNYNFATSATIPLTQGPVTDANGNTTNNDKLIWISPKDIFDRVVRRKDFSNALTATPPGQINTLSNEVKVVLEKRIQDDLTAGTTSVSQPANTGSFTQPSGKQVGTLPSTMTLNNLNYTKYYNNWFDQYRLATCSPLGTTCLTVAGTACRGALMFGGRNAGGAPRSSTQQQYSTANLGNYFEAGSGLEILNSTTMSFSGATSYIDSGTDASRAADVGICLFPGAFISLAQDSASFASGVTYSGTTPIAAVNTATQTVTLGDTGGGAGAGCVWYPTAIALSSSMRLYFRFQFVTKGDGFTVALADGATNLPPNSIARTQIMCGSTGSTRLGYAGSPSGGAPGIEKPKIGIEFDSLYSATRNDPPGDHMAFLFWGTTTDSDGSDDNTHYLGNGGVAITNASWAAGKATLTTASAHGFTAGQVVLVSGMSPTGYEGTVTVLASPAPTTTQFSYSVTSNPGAFASGGQAKAISTGSAPRNPRVATATRNLPVTIVASDTFGFTTRTTSYSAAAQRVSIVTSSPHGLSAGDQVVVSGVNPSGYNGTFTVLSSGLTTTRPYRFRYSMSTDPGSYISGGTSNKVTGSEISALSWGGATATADTPTSHGFSNLQNITTFGMTPTGFGATANLTLVNTKRFTYPVATDPSGSFSTETPAGMALVTTDPHISTCASPCVGFPSTSIHVRLDLTRSYDSTNHVAVLNLKAYVGDVFPIGEACSSTDFQNLSRDLADQCPLRGTTLRQDSIPVNALASISGATWSSGTGLVTVTTAAAHGLANGASVTIVGATPIAYNGTFTATVTGSNTFTIPLASNPGAYVSGGDIVPLSTFFLGFTNARGSSNAGENQSVTINGLLLRSQ